MREKEVQAAKFEAKFNFKEVLRDDFNEFFNFVKSDIKLLDINEVVYYTVASNNRVLGKSDYCNKKFYLAKKNNLPIDS